MSNIYLFPHGGAGVSSFHSYARDFPRDTGRIVPVEIPGHGRRSAEPFARSIQECALLTLEQIDTSRDYVLHGHCMGALIAFEVVKLIETSQASAPQLLVVSGRNAPRHVNDWLRRVADLDDRGLFAQLQDLGGIPRGLSFAMAESSLSVIRRDNAMFDGYDAGEAKIGIPILALAGTDDKMTNAVELADWADYTSKSLSIEWLDGQHLFILERPARVAELIARSLPVPVSQLGPMARE
jgi:surfactin synthase thioesterase subunit